MRREGEAEAGRAIRGPIGTLTAWYHAKSRDRRTNHRRGGRRREREERDLEYDMQELSPYSPCFFTVSPNHKESFAQNMKSCQKDNNISFDRLKVSKHQSEFKEVIPQVNMVIVVAALRELRAEI